MVDMPGYLMKRSGYPFRFSKGRLARPLSLHRRNQRADVAIAIGAGGRGADEPLDSSSVEILSVWWTWS